MFYIYNSDMKNAVESWRKEFVFVGRRKDKD